MIVEPQPAVRILPSACPLDCPDACSLELQVADGVVTRVGGTHRNALTDGFICGKVARLALHLYGPERLLHPLVRVGAKGEGRFERVSWDEALALVARRMLEARERFGGESILPVSYGGSNGMLTQDTTDARLFRRLGASRLARTVCAAPTGRAATGLYGKMPGVALADFVHSRLIVLWGVNPSASGIHLVPIVQAAQAAGAKLVVVDPRRIPLARRADLHLQPRPGSDLPLALALVRWLFDNGLADDAFLAAHTHGADELRRRAEPWTLERAAAASGVPAAAIEELARLYAASSPAVIRCGWGVERNRNGGSAVAAILALPAVGGKFGVRGGGYTMSNSGAWRFDPAAAIAAAPPSTRVVNLNRVGEALVDFEAPPVKVLFSYNANPLMTLPNQEKLRRGLLREDLFTVVFDQVMTDSALHADVVLPATAFPEHRDITRGYGAMVLQDAAPVAAPPGEARPNYDVFAELCRRTGVAVEGDPETADELAAALYGSLPQASRDRIADELAREGTAAPDCGATPVQFADSWPLTADRKIHLVPEALDREAPRGLYGFQPDPGTEQYPLALLSAATSATISSTFGQLRRGAVALEISPTDAAARRIGDGDPVRVHNGLGEVRCTAKHSHDLPSGVVYLPKGLWSHNTASGTTANALCPDTLSDLGGGACFNDARVEVERIDV